MGYVHWQLACLIFTRDIPTMWLARKHCHLTQIPPISTECFHTLNLGTWTSAPAGRAGAAGASRVGVFRSLYIRIKSTIECKNRMVNTARAARRVYPHPHPIPGTVNKHKDRNATCTALAVLQARSIALTPPSACALETRFESKSVLSGARDD